tara:strand:+ start:215 stop:1225 length:1011 start_codon:yes stop_codon:yes gene_type:complete
MTRVTSGTRNLITDVGGILVGNADDEGVRTGVTVVLCDEPAVAAVDVRGAAPGTRETELLDPTCLVDRIDAVVLSGGSAYGLDASSGTTDWLADHGRGFPTGGTRVPIVPCAILFDLLNGGEKRWGNASPYKELGRHAVEAAGVDFSLGNSGAGYGAIVGGLKGGLGSASANYGNVTVGAIVAVNAFGSAVIPGTSTLWSWPFECENELGGQSLPKSMGAFDSDYAFHSPVGAQTTIGVVATNVQLDKAQAKRVAMMAHDGLARAIRPSHTPFDGDTLFAIGTGNDRTIAVTPSDLGHIGMIAADCVARSVGRAVVEANTLGNMVSYRDFCGDALA